jgi:hypothetical protein
MFDRFRQKRNERRQAKQRAAFEDVAAARDQRVELDDRRLRDLPDPLGELNESVRLGPTIGGAGSP